MRRAGRWCGTHWAKQNWYDFNHTIRWEVDVSIHISSIQVLSQQPFEQYIVNHSRIALNTSHVGQSAL